MVFHGGLFSKSVVLVNSYYIYGTHVTRHVNSQNHTLANMKCLAIEKVHMDDTEKRQERGVFLDLKDENFVSSWT